MNNIIESLQSLKVSIAGIVMDPQNPRSHPDRNIAVIKRSLEFYGQRVPIVVNEATGCVEKGNGVLQAARELGWDEIAAVIVHDDQATATAFSIIDNKSAELSAWNLPCLKDLLTELDTGAFDMEMTGFDEKDLEQLFTQYHPDGPTEPEIAAEEKRKCPQCGYEW